jgi:hypothetical protein
MSLVVKLFPQSSPPPAEHCAPWSAAHDRAHVVAGAIIQIIQQALLRSLFDDDPTGLTTARPEIEALLCD